MFCIRPTYTIYLTPFIKYKKPKKSFTQKIVQIVQISYIINNISNTQPGQSNERTKQDHKIKTITQTTK
jgi:hypothetical protein